MAVQTQKLILSLGVADAIEFVLSRKPHVNINDLVIMPQAQAVAGVIIRKES